MNNGKKAAALLLACLLLGGCTGEKDAPSPASSAQESSSSQALSSSTESSALTLTDSNGTTLNLPEDPKVVSLYGSYAQAWLLAGGSLTGVTEDAVEREMDVGDAALVGTVKEPNTETVISLEPDLVLLSSDIAAHSEIRDVLENAGLACAYFQVDTFEDYAFMMEQFCGITGRQDLFDENVSKPKAEIERAKEKGILTSTYPSVLLIRAFSSGIKAKTDDELAGAILKDLGALNIAEEHPSMLEDLSLEEVISADPDFIFVTTMGNEQKALDYLNAQIEGNPAWEELTAVKNGRYVVLPKELFHYKPNNLWGKSYEYLADTLYPNISTSPK